MTDLDALKAIHHHPQRSVTTAELAEALGVPKDEAAARITVLAKDGFVAGPMLYRSVTGAWTEIGVNLTESGRDLVTAQPLTTPCRDSSLTNSRAHHSLR